jgi:hypothetical protein
MSETGIIDINSGTELILGNDELVNMAAQTEKRVSAINTIMRMALQMTTPLDWVMTGGNPYLQETGASKIAALMGVSWQIKSPVKVYDKDGSGHYTYQTSGEFTFAGRHTEAAGMRSTRDEFFIGSANAKDKDGNPKPQKNPQDVDERDVMQAAYTNCLNSGIKRTVPGLRNITADHLKEAGIDTDKIRGYGFNTGTPAEMSDEAKDLKAEIERMLKEMYKDDWATTGLKFFTTFTGKDGKQIDGKTDISKLSEKAIPVTYKKVKENYDGEFRKFKGAGGAQNESGGNNGETPKNVSGQDNQLSLQ